MGAQSIPALYMLTCLYFTILSFHPYMKGMDLDTATWEIDITYILGNWYFIFNYVLILSFVLCNTPSPLIL